MCKSLNSKCSVNTGLNTFCRRNVPLIGASTAQHVKKLACWQCKACVRNVQSTPVLNTFCRRNVPLIGTNAARHLKKLAYWQCLKACVPCVRCVNILIYFPCWKCPSYTVFYSLLITGSPCHSNTALHKAWIRQSVKSLCAPLCNNVLLITITFQKCPSHKSAVRPLKKLIHWHMSLS